MYRENSRQMHDPKGSCNK